MKSYIGKPVTCKWGGAQRYGVVKEESIVDEWKFLKIDWVADERYEASIKWRMELDPSFTPREMLRADKVRVIDINKEIKTLTKLKEKTNK